MASFAQHKLFGPFFHNGSLLTDGKLFHYAAGTSTLKTTWNDRAKSSESMQPLLSDANGLFECYGDGLYDFLLTDSSGATIRTFQDVLLQDPDPSGEGDSLASASTLVLGTDGDVFHVTGTTTIDAISGTQAKVTLVFDSAGLTLTHSASLILNGAVNHLTTANEIMQFLNEGGGVWRQIALSLETILTDVTLRKTIPRFRFRDTTDGQEYNVAVSGGDLLIQENTGTELSPTWTNILAYDKSATLWTVTGGFTVSGTLTGILPPVPIGTGTGSSYAHAGAIASSSRNESGIIFCTSLTLDNGHTITIPANSGRLIIVASSFITINGTITGSGSGAPGGALITTVSTPGNPGSHATDQPGGGGGSTDDSFAGGDGGNAYLYGIPSTITWSNGYVGGGAGGTGSKQDGSSGSAVTSRPSIGIDALMNVWGGAGGGSGGRSADGGSPGGGVSMGGAGGASIVLIAPTITLGATASLNTSGISGGGANDTPTLGGGGGGGAGNVYIMSRSFTDAGATFTLSGGTGASVGTSGGGGGNGGNGVKYIFNY